MQLSRRQNTEVNTHFSRTNQQAICHIIASVANEDQLSAVELADMLLNSHEVCQNLRRMKSIRQAIPDWYASIFR